MDNFFSWADTHYRWIYGSVLWQAWCQTIYTRKTDYVWSWIQDVSYSYSWGLFKTILPIPRGCCKRYYAWNRWVTGEKFDLWLTTSRWTNVPYCLWQFLYSLRLLHHLLEKKFSGSGTMQNNRCMEAPLKYVKKIEKLPGGSFDVMLETNSNTSVFCWKDSAMTVASWFVGSRLLDTAITCNRSERGKIEIDQPRMIHVYITCVHYMWSTTQHMPYAARNGGGIPLYSNFTLMLCSIIPFRYIKRRVFLQVSSLSTSSVHYLRVCQYLPENCSFTIKVWIYHIGIGRFW